MGLLREYLREILREYWGEPAGGVVRDQQTRAAQLDSPIDEDPFHLDDEKGVMVPKDVRKDIKKYFRDMKMEPTDKPGKTYK